MDDFCTAVPIIEAKQKCGHGKFEGWIQENCDFSPQQARRYMKLARTLGSERFDPEELGDRSIDSFLHTSGKKPKSSKAEPLNKKEFTKADAEHVKKLHAMAERGTENEAEVAKRKLSNFASGFGMTAEEAVEKAEEVDPTTPPGGSDEDRWREFVQEIDQRYKDYNRDQLIEEIAELILAVNRKG